MVDQVDEVKVPWEQLANEVDRPLLKGLWQHCVVSVRESVVDDLPRFIEVQLLLVDQNSE